MATDWVTSPYSRLDALFRYRCRPLTMIIRLWGYPEGVSFAILFMNALTPLINLMTRPKPQMESVRQVKERASLTRIRNHGSRISCLRDHSCHLYGAMSPRIENDVSRKWAKVSESCFRMPLHLNPLIWKSVCPTV